MSGPDIIGADDGAFAAGMLQGQEVRANVAFASAAAAIICRSLGGQADLPTCRQVLDFLAERDAG